jgi:hypothetical protein
MESVQGAQPLSEVQFLLEWEATNMEAAQEVLTAAALEGMEALEATVAVEATVVAPGAMEALEVLMEPPNLLTEAILDTVPAQADMEALEALTE